MKLLNKIYYGFYAVNYDVKVVCLILSNFLQEVRKSYVKILE